MEPLRIRVAGGVGRLTLTNPARHNAFDDRLVAALTGAVERLGADPSVRTLRLDAEGPSFCAGADLGWIRRAGAQGPGEDLADARRLARLLQTLDACPKPTLAVGQGPAYGGGVGLVAACDVAVAAQGARFALTEVRLGLIPATIGSCVVRAMVLRAARRHALTAEPFDAGEALRLGLLHEVCAPEAPEARAAAVEAALAHGAPGALAEAKALLAAIEGGPSTRPASRAPPSGSPPAGPRPRRARGSTRSSPAAVPPGRPRRPGDERRPPPRAALRLAPRRPPRRDRLPHPAHGPPDGPAHDGRRLGRRLRGEARLARPRGPPHRPGPGRRELPARRPADRGGAGGRDRGDPRGLRLPERIPGPRRGLRRGRPRPGRPDGRLDVAWGEGAEAVAATRAGAEVEAATPRGWRRRTLADPFAGEPPEEGAGPLRAPMRGSVRQILAAPGQRLARGEPVLILEAMKMEHLLRAPADGVLVAPLCAQGDAVAEGAELAVVEPDEEAADG